MWDVQVSKFPHVWEIASRQVSPVVGLPPSCLQTGWLYSCISSRGRWNSYTAMTWSSEPYRAGCTLGRRRWDFGRRGYILHVLSLALWHSLLYFMDTKLWQYESKINPGCQWKWNLRGERQNTHGKITKTMKIFYHRLKLTQL